MRFIGLLLSVLMLFGCSTQSYKTRFPVKDEIKSIYLASVSIMREVKDKREIVGSGVIIRHQVNQPIVILTAAHVFRKPVKYFIKLSYGYEEELEIKIDKLNKNVDLAVVRTLKLSGAAGPAVRVALDGPSIGETVWLIGSPLRDASVVTKGIITDYRYSISKKLLLYRTQAPAFFGNSGGGLFNSNGELVGILRSKMVIQYAFIIIPVEGTSFVTALPHIRGIL